MPKEEAVIQFYTVERCGYYKYNKTIPEFGSLEQTLSSLSHWIGGDDIVLRSSRTFEPEQGSNLRPTYCYDLEYGERHGDYLLTTWNEVPSTADNQIAGARGDAPIGEGDVELTQFNEEFIPGYATYFWFLSELNLFATIQFQNRIANGHPELQTYLEEYLARHNYHHVDVEGNPDGVDLDVNGYKESPDGEVREDLYPRFRSRPVRTAGHEQLIRANRERIYKIIRKSVLGTYQAEDIGLSPQELFFRFVGIDENVRAETVPDEMKARYEVNHTPSEEELESIIENWTQEESTTWNDVGFKLSNDSRTYWLSHAYSKIERELEVTRENEEVVNASSLRRALSSSRGELLANVPDEAMEAASSGGDN